MASSVLVCILIISPVDSVAIRIHWSRTGVFVGVFGGFMWYAVCRALELLLRVEHGITSEAMWPEV